MGGADSAAVPWHGRELSRSGFEADTGEADPGLLAALATPGDDVALMRAVEASRLLVPVVAERVDAERVDAERVDSGAAGVDSGGAHVTEGRADMALATLLGPDGRRALPVFSGSAALAAWDPAARPVPVTPARAAQAAVSQGCDVLVVDVAGPATRVLRSSMLWALAQERAWEPAHTDPFVARGVAAALAPEAAVLGHRLQEGDPAGEGVLGVVLTLRPGLAPDEVRELATRVGERLATDGELRARVDGLAFTIR